MAERKEADDEFNPRHRIVGAVILVALAVIFLPMVLNDQPQETGTAPVTEAPVADARMARVPLADDATPVAADRDRATAPARGTRIVTVPVDPVTVAPGNSRSGDAPPARPVAETPPPAPVATVEPARVERQPAPEPAASATSKAPVAARPATAGGGWIVQVGVFSQADNAHRLQERLKAKGYAVMLDPPGAPKGKNVRVEVGPYKDQAAAKTAAARIEREFDIKGIVRSQ